MKVIAMMKIGAVIMTAVIAGISPLFMAGDESPSVAPLSRNSIFDPRPNLPAPTTTTIPEIVAMSVRYEDRCPEWHDLARSVGISQDDFPKVMRILYRESRCSASAVNSTKNRNGSIDYGLSQINDRTWCLPTKYSKKGFLQTKGIISTCEDLLDPEKNLRSMVALMAYSEERTGCPFTPWLLCD